ncbi:MAG: 3-keto-5-aminohexanoate cleavage protein [Rhodovibrionaceae bacterium]|nr:3-keto-5-aminohexanoate cleavage protein [Rhodovibrionaceae bacterium]
MSAPEAWQDLVIAVAPNGARKTKADHPQLPMTPDELGRTAAACVEAGAAMIHLHVRDGDGGHTLDAEIYQDAIDAVRRDAGGDIVVQVTTEAVGIYRAEEQMACVRDLRPEAVSLAVREIIPDDAAETAAAEFLDWLRREAILPQYILYDDADVRRFEDLLARGVVPDHGYSVLFVLGRYAKGQVSQPADVLPFLNAKSAAYPWAVCAFGARETACVLTAAALGGHARVGFENNMALPDGTTAADNAALVGAVADGARAIGRPLADAAAARRILAGE